jgi:hypothetical protein
VQSTHHDIARQLAGEQKGLLSPQASSENKAAVVQLEMWELEDQFRQLTKRTQNKKAYNLLSEQEKIQIEKDKLAIMLKAQTAMEKRYGKPTKKPSDDLKTPKAAWWRKLLFGFLMIIDIALMTVGGYLGSLELLGLLAPHLASIAVSIIALSATGIEAVMMYAIFKPMLQEGLKIPRAPSSKETLAEKHDKKINALENMNALMVDNYEKHSSFVYGYHTRILKMFNDDVKNTELLSYKESIPKRILRYGLSTFNTILNLAGVYFGTVLLLTALSPVLVGTPVGWGIIATVAVAQLLSRLFIRKNAVFTMLNPSAAHHEATREKLLKFESKSESIETHMKRLEATEKLAVLEKKQSSSRPRRRVSESFASRRMEPSAEGNNQGSEVASIRLS